MVLTNWDFTSITKRIQKVKATRKTKNKTSKGEVTNSICPGHRVYSSLKVIPAILTVININGKPSVLNSIHLDTKKG